jgi:hypothetical protein
VRSNRRPSNRRPTVRQPAGSETRAEPVAQSAGSKTSAVARAQLSCGKVSRPRHTAPTAGLHPGVEPETRAKLLGNRCGLETRTETALLKWLIRSLYIYTGAASDRGTENELHCSDPHKWTGSDLKNCFQGLRVRLSFRVMDGVRSGTAAHNAVGLAGESPAVGIDCLPT